MNLKVPYNEGELEVSLKGRAIRFRRHYLEAFDGNVAACCRAWHESHIMVAVLLVSGTRYLGAPVHHLP